MTNLAKMLKLRTYEENGGISETKCKVNNSWYTIKIKNGKMVASKILWTNEMSLKFIDDINETTKIFYKVAKSKGNLFINRDDAKKVINYIEETLGIPNGISNKLPSWDNLDDDEVTENVKDIFKSFLPYENSLRK